MSKESDRLMFANDMFDVYNFDAIPLNTDLFLMDKKYMREWRDCLANDRGNGCEKIGFIDHIAARGINLETLELSWYPNVFTRFHEVPINLPKDQFVACVGSSRWDEKPHVFVESSWLESLHCRAYAMFGFIDAIGMKDALKNSTISQEKLRILRDGLDALACAYPDVAFVSFADSIILKSIWSAKYVSKGAPQSYSPERLIEVFRRCQELFREVLGLESYGIFAQGSNEFYFDNLLHISKSGNHISLNSLGIPFAQLLEIDADVRKKHTDSERKMANLYIDSCFFNSLKLHYTHKDKFPQSKYESKIMKRDGVYRYTNCKAILTALSVSDPLTLKSDKAE